MKCSGKTEILYELVHDTTRKSENHELILPQCRNFKHFIVEMVHFNTCLRCHNLVVFRYFYENVSSERCGNPVETCLRLPLYGCHMNLVDNIILIFGENANLMKSKTWLTRNALWLILDDEVQYKVRKL